MPLVPQDFLANRKGMRDFAAASQQVATKYSSRAEAAARLSHSLLKGGPQLPCHLSVNDPPITGESSW